MKKQRCEKDRWHSSKDVKGLITEETDRCAFFYSETKQTQNWQHKQRKPDTWSCLVEACVFKPLRSNLSWKSWVSLCFKTWSPCSRSFLCDTRGISKHLKRDCGAFCCLFLLVKHSLSGPVQQSGRACAMPSRTFLADTSCLQAAFLCAHTPCTEIQ